MKGQPSDSKAKKRQLKYLALGALVLQTTTLVLLMRYTMTRSGPKYLASTAVILSEILKVLICCVIVGVDHFDANTAKRGESYLGVLHGIIFSTDALKMAVPAGLYAIQNNLLYYALANLEPAPYQVIYQLKVFTTALFSVFILRRTISWRKWGALFLLFFGFVMVQVSVASQDEKEKKANVRPYVALVAVLISCVTSGFAGVYFEWVLKGTSATLWDRNIQLGLFGMAFSGVISLIGDAERLSKEGFFVGYTSLVILVVIIQAAGGLIIATVVKYADNILKGFALAISIVISSLVSIYFFNFALSWQFVIGSFLVVGAVVLYSQPDVQKIEDRTKNDNV